MREPRPETPLGAGVDPAGVSFGGGAIPPALIERLAAEGIHSIADWAALSRARKRKIFGITIAHVRLLDRLAREQRP